MSRVYPPTLTGKRSTSVPASTPRYRGSTSVTSQPSRARAGGSAPSTSASPPVFTNGTASEPMIRSEGAGIALILWGGPRAVRVERSTRPRYNRSVTQSHQPHPPRAPRSETREIVELKRLKTDQPELGSAVDMQLALVEMQRRVQSRAPPPWISPPPTCGRGPRER